MSLEEYDDLYKFTVSNLPIDQRIWYCTKNLDKLQGILINNQKSLTSTQKSDLVKRIKVLQDELIMLRKQLK